MPPSDHSGDHSPRSISSDALLWEVDKAPAHSKSKALSTRMCSGARLGRFCIALVMLSLACSGVVYLGITTQHPSIPAPVYIQLDKQDDVTDNSKLLRNRNATSRFRDNLSSSPDHKFITAWPSSGWTNDVIAAINLVYMASLVGRTPILPPFTPSHVGSINEVGPLRFGDIFNVPRLAAALNMHILEWEEVKSSRFDAQLAELNGVDGVVSEPEKLGCWSAWWVNRPTGNRPRDSDVPALYNLDISYTPVPQSFTLSKGLQKDQYYTSLWSLASLSYGKTRDWALASEGPKAFPLMSGSDEKVVPDDKLLCFDLLYYIGLANEEEWWTDYSPYWRTIGKHLHWSPKLYGLAYDYLVRHFNLQEGDRIPPFISVHVRRADFAGWCPSNMNREACFATPQTYAKRVREVRTSLLERGIDAQAVLVTSDERDPAWWEEIAELGPEWRWIDHSTEKTVERHGKWYPVILDAVFQSMGAGFVGTDRSTMSLLSQRRVEDWNEGVSAAVKWGSPDADDH